MAHISQVGRVGGLGIKEGAALVNGLVMRQPRVAARVRMSSTLHAFGHPHALASCLERPRGDCARLVSTKAAVEDTDMDTAANDTVREEEDFVKAQFVEENSLPGECDAVRFEEMPSVAFWRNWVRKSPADDMAKFINNPSSFTFEEFESMQPTTLSEWGGSDTQSLRYWSYHLLRSIFFSTQGIIGLQASRLARQAQGDRLESAASSFGYVTSSSAARLLTEALQMFRQDFSNIRQGLYKEPWDMQIRHRQWNPLYVLGNSARFITEAARTLSRREKQEPDRMWLKSALYPEYYMSTWHYQTDGWLSSTSAAVYETSTETLFLGQQDAMQRQTLVPLVKHLRTMEEPEGGFRLMELACGTGRFATFIRDNYPKMHISAVDLSPFYLQAARRNMEYWYTLNGSDGLLDQNSFVQCPAEDLQCEDGAFDAITCVYLFHELEASVRRRVVREMFRSLKKGGIVVLTDSVQLGDRPELDERLDAFTDFNEPNYSDYLRTDLGKLFMEEGFTCGEKGLASRSKVLSFIKP